MSKGKNGCFCIWACEVSSEERVRERREDTQTDRDRARETEMKREREETERGMSRHGILKTVKFSNINEKNGKRWYNVKV